ncbi:hypothetical protein DXG03_008262 [Asterophora parasitica]|uniref:Protein kinase domain-containing protein n=1 Tax=Asterophora parasitica TaxID=117018 RepID=A0A9P7KD41_9AGAR|nr:hypothetical protein DXG03_008262 [Asterophora parasitica]
MKLSRLFRGLSNAMGVADTLGAPFVGPAAIIFGEIAEGCEKVAVHKYKAKLMSDRCAIVLSALSEEDPELVGTPLQTKADEVAAISWATQELLALREHPPTPSRQDDLMFAGVGSSSPPLLPTDGHRYLEYQRGLFELHNLTGIPPIVKVLNGEIVKVGDVPIAGGTYCDVWEGRWLGKKKVAVKVLRAIKATDQQAHKHFKHEIRVWAKLENPNILPFYGIVTDQDLSIEIISPWQDNGNVLEYVSDTPDANKIHLLSGAAKGLAYLHSRNIIHGNLKCANILVSSTGAAVICDFGMSKIVEDVTRNSASATLGASGSTRWMAPELIEGEETSVTKEADVYSFAMAILELLTGKPPYSNRRHDASVIQDIVVLKQFPQRPTEPAVLQWLTDNVWELMTECWTVPASSRPLMSMVSARLNEIDELRR